VNLFKLRHQYRQTHASRHARPERTRAGQKINKVANSTGSHPLAQDPDPEDLAASGPSAAPSPRLRSQSKQKSLEAVQRPQRECVAVREPGKWNQEARMSTSQQIAAFSRHSSLRTLSEHQATDSSRARLHQRAYLLVIFTLTVLSEQLSSIGQRA